MLAWVSYTQVVWTGQGYVLTCYNEMEDPQKFLHKLGLAWVKFVDMTNDITTTQNKL